MKLAFRLCAVVFVLTAMAVLAGAAASGATAGPLRACTLGAQASRHLGPTYVTSLKVHDRTCTFARQLVRAYYRCRVAHGGVAGRCPAKVLGFACRETRQGIAIQFDAVVTCRRGAARVRHTYTQDT
ncbi:hypothetical protein NBH00_00130 [Paraconexibacter antarcticus]|uniref:Secreted protein n=1 Tax=Paraconexibacter antarcticus TaxID=2949664 RepID=A0ABY5DTM6_9ACTN|nr:hypothetical protein [Paraconexibacter antarcticus]UTI64633.1 hypothetical protein NBH00_00130 [Paraconexibacter antarcticus]